MLSIKSQVRRGNFFIIKQMFQKRDIKTEEKIASLGLQMPEAGTPKGSFVNYLKLSNNLVYLSGHLPQPAEGDLYIGKVGKDFTVEQGYDIAKVVGLNLCATLKQNLGDLDRVKKVVKLTGFVNCVDGFSQQPQVINGCSELFVKIWGTDKGSHTRSAVGTNSLPLNVPVEIEAIFEIENDN